MRIQRAEHAEDRRLIDIVVIQLVAVDVMILDDTQCFAEVLAHGSGRGSRRVNAWPASSRGSSSRLACRGRPRVRLPLTKHETGKTQSEKNQRDKRKRESVLHLEPHKSFR